MLSVSLEDRRGYLTLVIFCQKEGRLVIRKTEGIREWYDSLNMFLTRSKITEERKMESTEQFWDRAAKKDVGKIQARQVHLYHKEDDTRNLIIKAMNKLFTNGHVSLLKDLPKEQQDDILTQPVQYFIPWHVVFKASSISTPARLFCQNPPHCRWPRDVECLLT